MTAEILVDTPPRGGQRLRLLLHSRSGMVGLVVVCLLLVVAVLQAVGLLGYNPLTQAPAIRLQGPTAAH